MSLKLLALAGVAAQAIVGIEASSVVHEKRDVETMEPWVKVDRIEPHITLPVRIGLKQNAAAMDKAHDWLMEVADPESEKFGKHWTQDEVIAAFRPTDDAVERVIQWLEQAGAISRDRVTHTDNKAWLALDASTAELEQLLETEYYEHNHPDTGRSMITCDEYRIPEELKEHIDYITPGVKGIHVENQELRKRSVISKSRPPKKHPNPYMPHPGNELKTCDVAITPACLQALYQFQPADPSVPVSKNNSMGIFEEGSYYSQLDLNSLFTNFTSIPNGTHPILKSIDGGLGPVKPSQAGGEADLDFELAIPIIYPQTTTLYSTDDPLYASGQIPTKGIFNTFLDAIDGSYCTYSAYGETGNDPKLDPKYPDHHKGGYKGKLMCGTYKPTNVISISYGEQEISLPAFYQKRQCNEYLKLGLQGVSIFVASGDSGVAGFPGDGAGTKNGCLKNGKVFSPTQPNSCPYLTNVGATKVYPGHTVHEPESAANDPAGHPYASAFSSGGGFSNLFTTPDYQQSAVASYFANHNPPYPYYTNGNYTNSNGIYNRNGRGIPDVAANGDNIVTYIGGRYGLSGGTSASSPIFASLVNRIIEERIRHGKGPLGFINPTLYKNPGVLNDITNGTNPGCGSAGFSAVKGWDPVTGLGTPNYPKMLKLFLSLP